MKLFASYDLSSCLRETDRKIAERVDRFTNDEIMANDLSILCDVVYEEFKIEPLIVLDEDVNRRSVVNGKIQKWFAPPRYWTESGQGEYHDVDGLTIKFAYPFTGTRSLFQCRASRFTYSSEFPEVTVEKGIVWVTLQYQIEETKAESWKEQVEQRVVNILNSVRQNVSWVNNDLNSWSSGVRGRMLSLLQQKRSKVESFYAAAKLFDVSPKINSVGAQIVSVKKRIIPIVHSYQAEEERYCISSQSYEDTLSVIKNTASTWEQTPDSYRGMNEEDLRNVLRSSLNACFEGLATGEAFRHKGKTDICIEEKNRAAFVAECKMWTGENHLAGAFAQLDGYTTWRDCKTALIYFVRRKDFLAVLDRAEAALKNLECIHSLQKLDRNVFKCQYASTSTPGRLNDVRIMLFNLNPTKADTLSS